MKPLSQSPWAKLMAIGAIVGVLILVLARIGWLVDERRGRQLEAIQSVQQSQAGAQAVLGPWLHRRCTEEWEVELGEGKDRRQETQRREFTLDVAATRLQVAGQALAETRYRGLFKVNGYLGRLGFDADWSNLAALEPTRNVRGSRLACEPVELLLALTDTRGVQSAEVRLDGQAQRVIAGTGLAKYANGLHALLEERPANEVEGYLQ